METTLHNHVKLGSKEKPLIPNAVFKALLTLCEHKDQEACDYILKNYTLAPSQKIMYEQTESISNDHHRPPHHGA
jgi:hypothetical protein